LSETNIKTMLNHFGRLVTLSSNLLASLWASVQES